MLMSEKGKVVVELSDKSGFGILHTKVHGQEQLTSDMFGAVRAFGI
jgi:hypothetical protein